MGTLVKHVQWVAGSRVERTGSSVFSLMLLIQDPDFMNLYPRNLRM